VAQSNVKAGSKGAKERGTKRTASQRVSRSATGGELKLFPCQQRTPERHHLFQWPNLLGCGLARCTSEWGFPVGNALQQAKAKPINLL